MSAYDVLSKFFDQGSFNEVDALLKSKNGQAEAVSGFGTVDGMTVYAFAQDVDVCGGAMSRAQAKKIVKIYDLALKNGSPVVGFYDSLGGRIEDSDILDSYGSILNKTATLSGVVPMISVVLGTCLGTSAMTAATADFLIMKKDASLSVSADPDDASSEANAENGIADFICDDEDSCIETLKDLLSYLPENNLESCPEYEALDPAPGKCLATFIADEGSSLCINKEFGGKTGTALARVNGSTVGIVSVSEESISRQGAAKITKMVRFCDAFSIPLITIVDSCGFDSVKSAAKVASVYAEATTAKISVVSGKAIGSAYISLCGAGANCDMVYALDNSIVSPVAPLAAAFILDGDNMNVPKDQREEKAMEFVKCNLSALNAAQNGYIDDVVSNDMLRVKISASLDMLSSKRVSSLPKKHSTI